MSEKQAKRNRKMYQETNDIPDSRVVMQIMSDKNGRISVTSPAIHDPVKFMDILAAAMQTVVAFQYKERQKNGQDAPRIIKAVSLPPNLIRGGRG